LTPLTFEIAVGLRRARPPGIVAALLLVKNVL